ATRYFFAMLLPLSKASQRFCRPLEKVRPSSGKHGRRQGHHATKKCPRGEPALHLVGLKDVATERPSGEPGFPRGPENQARAMTLQHWYSLSEQNAIGRKAGQGFRGQPACPLRL